MIRKENIYILDVFRVKMKLLFFVDCDLCTIAFIVYFLNLFCKSVCIFNFFRLSFLSENFLVNRCFPGCKLIQNPKVVYFHIFFHVLALSQLDIPKYQRIFQKEAFKPTFSIFRNL